MSTHRTWKRVATTVAGRGIGAVAAAFALVVAVLLGGTVAGATSAEAKPAGWGSGRWACAGEAVDPGNVNTDHDPKGCGGRGSWYQEPAKDGIWTCSGSPVVTGYVITGHQRTGCDGAGAWLHNIARVGLLTCPGSPVPAGFRSTTYQAGGCNGLGAWVLARA
ncbi:hypothetical protein OG196_37600 [Kitasatospora purpeofusca]|uniref:hypothetical protein n=1 Tax=Kitasatospora purpeofusca TaxID=67352 RepID=UPI002E151E9A|nr:hypothetical protein OG196_37600 [Kitasatospora purpeofusca]